MTSTMTISPKQLVNNTVELASLPTVIMQAMELLNDPNASAPDIGNVIQKDPALTAKLLKIVNSAFYGFPSRIETVSRAITVVGTLELTDLVLGSSAIELFEHIPNELVDMQQFWEHSLYCGAVARTLAQRLRSPNSERCFVFGLLHNIGSLILYRECPKQARAALEQAATSNSSIQAAEQEIFGFDHGAVGAELMRSWKLPEGFIEITMHHHQPMQAERYRLETTTIHLADVIAGIAEKHPNNSGQITTLEDGSWELIGLSSDATESVIEEADVRFAEALPVLLPKSQAA